MFYLFVFFKQKTAYEMRISDWSSDVCSSDLFLHDHRAVERLIAVRTEKFGEMRGLDLAEQDVAVGDGQRAAAAIGGGAGDGARAFGTDEEARAVPAADPAAAPGDGGDAQHTSAEPRVGLESVSTVSVRVSPHSQKKNNKS